ncbi:MAG: hypothetical protein EWM72_01317 [Nitrospira sp.]|nr:MAG: hypothetical protein EWM72_01317 [Nitrospira sp.]
MKRLLLITLLTLSSGPAYAGWVSLGGDEKLGLTIYVNPETMSRNGDQMTMWIMYDFETLQTKEAGNSFLSAKVQREYDCTKERTRLLAITKYSDKMGNGKVVFTSNFDEQEWAPVAPLTPGTIAQDLWTLACGKQ